MTRSISDVLLGVSGVDRETLAKAPRDTARFVGVGGALVTTAVMAWVSMTIAVHMALHAPWVLACAFGALWALGILNLDRWIVSATKRQGRWYQDVAMIVPRLLLAGMIGVIISEPLVLTVFRSEIAGEMVLVRNEKQADFARRLATDPRYTGLAAQEQTVLDIQARLAGGVAPDAVTAHPEVVALTQQLVRTREELAAAEQAVACEGSGTCGSGTAGAGPVFAQNLLRRDRLVRTEAELTAALAAKEVQVLEQARQAFAAGAADERARLQGLQDEIAATRAARVAEVAENDVRVAQADGLLAQIGALHRLTDREPAMATARWALFLFILAIELMPVLVKLMMNLAKPSTYDLFLEDADHADLGRARLRLQVEREEARMEADVALDAAEAQARTELDARVAAARTVLAAQVELVDLTTRLWREEQELRIAQDVEAFIDSTYGEATDDRPKTLRLP